MSPRKDDIDAEQLKSQCCKIARIQFSKQEAILEVLEVDWRKGNVIGFMVGELVGAAVNWAGAVGVGTLAVCQGGVGPVGVSR